MKVRSIIQRVFLFFLMVWMSITVYIAMTMKSTDDQINQTSQDIYAEFVNNASNHEQSKIPNRNGTETKKP